MDLSTIKPSEIMVDIVHPKTHEKLGITVTVVSLNDDKMKKLKRKIADENYRLQSRGKTMKSSDVEDNVIALTSEAMTGWIWEGDANWKGEKPQFNPKTVKEVLNELPWFLEQVSVAISEERDFF